MLCSRAMGAWSIVRTALCIVWAGSAAGRTTKCADHISAWQTMNKCMATIGGSLEEGGVGFKLFSDFNTTRTLCKEGKLQDTTSCLEEVYNDCAAESKIKAGAGQEPVSFLLDVGKWRKGMERLCNNVDYLQDHDACTQKTMQSSSDCLRRESQNFVADIQNLLSSSDRTNMKKEQLELSCRFGSKIIHCFKQPLESEVDCPCRYRSIIVQSVAETIPRFCSDVDTDYYYYYQNNDCDYGDDSDDDNSGGKEADGADQNYGPYGGFSSADPSKIKVRVLNAPRPEYGKQVVLQPQPETEQQPLQRGSKADSGGVSVQRIQDTSSSRAPDGASGQRSWVTCAGSGRPWLLLTATLTALLTLWWH